MKRLRLLFLTSFVLVAASCSTGIAEPQVVDEFHEAQLTILEARPGNELTDEEVAIYMKGIFINACARISRVSQQLSGKVITMEIETDRTGSDGCETRADSTAEFIHVVPIDAEALLPGVYTVKVGNMTTRFEVE